MFVIIDRFKIGGYIINIKVILMKKKIKQSNESLDLLIDNHPNPMAIADIDGTILAVNDRITGKEE